MAVNRLLIPHLFGCFRINIMCKINESSFFIPVSCVLFFCKRIYSAVLITETVVSSRYFRRSLMLLISEVRRKSFFIISYCLLTWNPELRIPPILFNDFKFPELGHMHDCRACWRIFSHVIVTLYKIFVV